MLRDAGRYVIVGQYTDAGDATINPHRHVNRRHATVLGCWGYEFTHFHRAIALLRRHDRRLGWRRLVSREYPLDRAGEALAAMAALEVVKAVIRP
jgi:L-iditol 2-dehydrogenase